jgi:flagellar protein FlbD
MIKLTHLGGEPFILNAELIQYVEARPDTFVTLTTGERLVVTGARPTLTLARPPGQSNLKLATTGPASAASVLALARQTLDRS